jgi:hypothetical protein
MDFNTKYLDVFTYNEPDAPLFDLWYSKSTYYASKFDRTIRAFGHRLFDGTQEEFIKIELTLFRKRIWVTIHYNKKYIGVDAAGVAFKKQLGGLRGQSKR